MNTIANKIDHTMLKPEATTETIRRYCERGKRIWICFCMRKYIPCSVSCRRVKRHRCKNMLCCRISSWGNVNCCKSL